MNNASLPQHQKFYPTELSYSDINSSSQRGRVSKLHDGGLYEGSEDKGPLARYIASFLISLDEAVMESLVDSRNRMAMYESGGVESSSVGPPLPSQSSEVRFSVVEFQSNSAQCIHTFATNLGFILQFHNLPVVQCGEL
jgi:hypothetical protein